MNFGKTLKEIRTYDLITQEEIANILGINKKTYGLYEIQIKTIPLKHLNTFCNYFDISLDYFLKFTKSKYYNETNKNINYELVSKRMKEIRKEHNLTQEKIVSQLKIDRTTYNKYENGKNKITTDFLYSFCKKYNISADYLLGKIDEPKYLD